jgi:hypothetical protein
VSEQAVLQFLKLPRQRLSHLSEHSTGHDFPGHGFAVICEPRRMTDGTRQDAGAAWGAANGSNRNSSEAAQRRRRYARISTQTCVQVPTRGTPRQLCLDPSVKFQSSFSDKLDELDHYSGLFRTLKTWLRLFFPSACRVLLKEMTVLCTRTLRTLQ